MYSCLNCPGSTWQVELDIAFRDSTCHPWDPIFISSPAPPYELPTEYTMLLFHYSFKLTMVPVLGVPKTTPRFGYSLSIIQHIIICMTMIYFQKKSHIGQSPEETGLHWASRRLLSVGSHRKQALHSSRNTLWQHVWDVISGKLIGDSVFGVSIGHGHIDIQCRPCTKIPSSQKVCSMVVLFAWTVQAQRDTLTRERWETLPRVKFPGASQGDSGGETHE